MKRASGIILPVFSLPSPYGVGTLGKAARDFVDFLADARQSWWQVLPVGPTSYGDSPYQSPSAFAGNPYFVDLDLLVADGLLTQAEIEAPNWGDDPARVAVLTCCAVPAGAGGSATRTTWRPLRATTPTGLTTTCCSWP